MSFSLLHSNLDLESSDYIEGIGDEVLISFLVIICTLVAGFLIFRFWFTRDNTMNDDAFDEAELDPSIPVREVIDDNGRCPICLSNNMLFALETSCGHKFCGPCMSTLYYTNDRYGIRPLPCPMCRQQINLLYASFYRATDIEQTRPNRYREGRAAVLDFVRFYNRQFNENAPFSWTNLRNLPTVLRRLWNDFFTIGGVMRIRLRLRILLCFVLAVLYLFFPHDVFPETVFGIVGFIDDILVLLFVVIYLAVLYRNAVVNEDFMDIRNDDLEFENLEGGNLEDENSEDEDLEDE